MPNFESEPRSQQEIDGMIGRIHISLDTSIEKRTPLSVFTPIEYKSLIYSNVPHTDMNIEENIFPLSSVVLPSDFTFEEPAYSKIQKDNLISRYISPIQPALSQLKLTKRTVASITSLAAVLFGSIGIVAATSPTIRQYPYGYQAQDSELRNTSQPVNNSETNPKISFIVPKPVPGGSK